MIHFQREMVAITGKNYRNRKYNYRLQESLFSVHVFVDLSFVLKKSALVSVVYWCELTLYDSCGKHERYC